MVTASNGQVKPLPGDEFSESQRGDSWEPQSARPKPQPFDTINTEPLPPEPPSNLTERIKAAMSISENDSRTPYTTKGCANHFPTPVPLSDLKPTPGREAWFLHGYLAPGAVTLLTAIWKGGKTTWLSHMLAQFAQEGMFCGMRMRAAKVLIVSEEPSDIWIERRDRLAIGNHVHILIRPFVQRPVPGVWVNFIRHLATLIADNGYQIVIVDPLANVWPVRDENDATQTIDALNPIRLLTEKGAAVLLVLHPRKSGGDEATAARGSGAISAFADILLEMRRMTPTDSRDRRRVIVGHSRYRETSTEKVVELSDDGQSYAALGDRAEAGGKLRAEHIAAILPAEPPGLSVEEILDEWPNGDKPSKRSLEIALTRGVEDRSWQTTGAGKKGDPRRFCSKVATPFDN